MAYIALIIMCPFKILLSLIHTKLILMLGVLFLFAAFVWHAFSYLCLTIAHIGIVAL